jgi:hypothetical protein
MGSRSRCRCSDRCSPHWSVGYGQHVRRAARVASGGRPPRRQLREGWDAPGAGASSRFTGHAERLLFTGRIDMRPRACSSAKCYSESGTKSLTSACGIAESGALLRCLFGWALGCYGASPVSAFGDEGAEAPGRSRLVGTVVGRLCLEDRPGGFPFGAGEEPGVHRDRPSP